MQAKGSRRASSLMLQGLLRNFAPSEKDSNHTPIAMAAQQPTPIGKNVSPEMQGDIP
jgi:hypothetical protein